MPTPIDWPTRDPVAHRVAATPQRTALIDVATDTDWTFREYDRRVDRLAAALESAALAGERIGVLMDTRPAFATFFFAAMRTGTTVVALNVRETTGELAAKVERTDLTAIGCERGTEATALEVATDTGSVDVYSVDEPQRDRTRMLARPETSATLEAAPERDAQLVEATTLARDETQLIMFTSGTSGEPKAVRLTVGNLVASATASAFRLGVGPDDRWLCCLPMYHMGG
ncbi:MAG TPA: AMP-binding protein, partial [Natronoarchaeum rubrum]|nr:AMP-binding protein [Natronoarchaeum rubrum]